jgi:hypothetical protein
MRVFDGGAVVQFRQQQHEFIAAQPRHVMALAGKVVQAAGGLFEDLVADGLAQRLVHMLEVIEVEQADGQQVAMRARALPARSAVPARCGWAGR